MFLLLLRAWGSTLWVYLAAMLGFLPGFMPLPGAWMGCDRKHGAVIKPLPRQEVSHRKDTLIYALFMFLSLPSQTDLNWREYSVSCSRLNKNLSMTSFQEMDRSFLQPRVEREQQTDGEEIFFWSPEDEVWFPQNFLLLNVIWMWRDWFCVGCFCWWLITHGLVVFRAPGGTWVDAKAQNLSVQDFCALSITSGIFRARMARDSVHIIATTAINTWLCGVYRTMCVCVYHQQSDTY